MQSHGDIRWQSGDMVQRLEGRVTVWMCHKKSPEGWLGQMMEDPKQ